MRAALLAILLLAILQARATQKAAEIPARLQRQALLDAMERMDARWSGQPESASPPLLSDFPDRSGWEQQTDPRSLAASRYFPPPSLHRDLSQNWIGNEFPSPAGMLVVSWYAGISPETPQELLLLATVTSPLLGAPVEGNATPRDAIRGQERLRKQMESLCGSCAPAGGLLPTYSRTPFPVSIWVAAEVGARGTGELVDPVAPLAHLASRIRRGEEVPEEALGKAGQAGLVALEWGRSGNRQRIPRLLQLALEGPSAADRLAALSAAIRLAGGAQGLVAWEGLPGLKEAVRRARLLDSKLAPLL